MPNKLVDTSPQLVDALATGSEVLQEITDNFTPLMKRFCLYFFWEQNKTDLVTTYDYVRCDGLHTGIALASLLTWRARLWTKALPPLFSTTPTGQACRMITEAYAGSPRVPHLVTGLSLQHCVDTRGIRLA
jgi:hypothetical protein